MKGIAFLPGFIGALLTLGIILPANSQVTSDNTTNTTVNSTGNSFNILNGIQKGNNLFHSFQEFSIPTGGSAVFNNSTDVVNIINRVTGGNISNIDGLIKASGNANLFLINPAGITFNENARLDIGGSFFGSTAESLLFKDEFEFSAVNPQNKPLLTVSVPIGLQMGQNPGNIQINGSGYSLDRLSDFSLLATSNSNLQVKTGKTLGLIGGNITMTGSRISTNSGDIQLASVTKGFIDLNSTSSGWKFDYKKVSEFGDIKLDQAIINALSPGGEINLQAKNVFLHNDSNIIIQNRGLEPSDGININTAESIEINDSAITAESGFSTVGDISISTKRLILSGGEGIRSLNSLTPGSNIIINASESIELQSPDPLDPDDTSEIDTATFGDKKAGNIRISTGNLTLWNGARVSSVTRSQGNSGNITIDAKSIQVTGTTSDFFASIISSGSLAEGDAGTLLINTDKLTVQDGGRVDSSIVGSSKAGNITINANEFVEVSGTVPGSINPSSIVSSAILLDESLRISLGLPPLPTGDSANLIINTPQLRVLDGGVVSVRNDGTSGNAGTLQINADDVLIDNQGSVNAIANGRGGDIFLDAETVNISNGGQINASTKTNQGGNIQLQVSDNLNLHNTAGIIANAQQAGQGGNINITASETTLSQGSRVTTDVRGTATGGELRLSGDRLSLLSGSRLSVITSGSGDAGNVVVNVGDIEVSGIENTKITGVGITPTPSFIAAGTFPGSSGKGGSLIIDSNRIRITDGGLIAAGTFGSGASGDVKMNASEFIEVTGVGDKPAPFFGYFTDNHPSHVSATSFSNASAGSVTIQSDSIVVADGGLVEVNAVGKGGGGNLELYGNRIFLNNNASLQAQVTGGNQGNISVEARDLTLLRNNSTITTNASGIASGGNININSPIVAGFENSDIAANAVQGNGGNINITTQGIFGLEFRDKLTPENDITASSEYGVNGTVEINNVGIDPSSGLIELTVELSDSSQQISTGCLNKTGSNFVVTGRGGVPQNPSKVLNTNYIWSDTRDLSVSRRKPNNNSEVTSISNKPAIVEATGFIRNASGEIELVAAQQQPLTAKQIPSCSGANT